MGEDYPPEAGKGGGGGLDFVKELLRCNTRESHFVFKGVLEK
jgi:hypothetical protein